MNILITGANGFIGRNLVEKFSKNGHNIYALSTNNNNLRKFSNVSFDSMQLEEISSLREKILSFEPDVVIHCAWAGASAYKDTNNIEQFDNVKHSLDLLKILTEMESLYFVCIGTMAEYGVKHTESTEEDKENPSSLYGISKYTFNLYSKNLCEKHNFKWLWIRPSYVYGENDVKTRLIPSIISKCLENEDLVLNSCDSVVDYIYIEDFVNGIYKLIGSKGHGIFNVCSGQEYRIKDIINFIYNFCDTTSTISFDESLDRQNFPKYICGTNEKLFVQAGWAPQITITQGLVKTIKYSKKEKTNGSR